MEAALSHLICLPSEDQEVQLASDYFPHNGLEFENVIYAVDGTEIKVNRSSKKAHWKKGFSKNNSTVEMLWL